jgi:hypothetical protein
MFTFKTAEEKKADNRKLDRVRGHKRSVTTHEGNDRNFYSVSCECGHTSRAVHLTRAKAIHAHRTHVALTCGMDDPSF